MNQSWIVSQKTVYWAQSDAGSSVQKLIFNIFEKFHDQSFFILRKPIATTSLNNPADQSMVKLSAKSIRFNSTFEEFEKAIKDSESSVEMHQEFVESLDFKNSKLKFSNEAVITQKNALSLLNQFESQIPRGEILHDFNRKIVAVLADEAGKLICVNSNFNFRNKILHAEANLVQSYLEKFNQKIPNNYQIFVSLKPCRMCADAIWKNSESGIKIFYGQNDPGRLAKGSQIEASMFQL